MEAAASAAAERILPSAFGALGGNPRFGLAHGLLRLGIGGALQRIDLADDALAVLVRQRQGASARLRERRFVLRQRVARVLLGPLRGAEIAVDAVLAGRKRASRSWAASRATR